MSGEENGPVWEAVIGRSLAYLCLQSDHLKTESLTNRAKFLKGLGLSTNDAAGILNTSAASIYELFRQAKKTRGSAKKNAKKTSARRH